MLLVLFLRLFFLPALCFSFIYFLFLLSYPPLLLLLLLVPLPGKSCLFETTLLVTFVTGFTAVRRGCTAVRRCIASVNTV